MLKNKQTKRKNSQCFVSTQGFFSSFLLSIWNFGGRWERWRFNIPFFFHIGKYFSQYCSLRHCVNIFPNTVHWDIVIWNQNLPLAMLLNNKIRPTNHFPSFPHSVLLCDSLIPESKWALRSESGTKHIYTTLWI